MLSVSNDFYFLQNHIEYLGVHSMKFVADTNVLMQNPHLLDEYDNIVLLNSVLRELDKHKICSNNERAFKARKASRYIDENISRIEFDFKDYQVHDVRLDSCYEDNKIISACIENDYILLTYDRNMKYIAKGYGIQVIELDDKTIDLDYKGYKFVEVNNEELAKFYENKYVNYFDLLINQYVILRDMNKNTLDKFRWNGDTHVNLSLPPRRFIKAKNDLQECALDMLMNKDIPVKFIAGTYGSGKSYIATRMGLFHVKEKGNQSKMYFVRNPIGTGEEIGFLPGDLKEKTGGFFESIVQHLDQGELEAQLMEQRGELESNIPYMMKGLSIPDSYILVDEAEDLNVKTIKMLGTRPSENTQIVFSGDWNQAEDKYINNNGMKMAINALKGNNMVGVVVMDIDVRSDVSKIFADWN